MGKILGLIPARMESTRFPGKPIVDIYGLPMVVRVYQQAQKCADLSAVFICTDSQVIKQTAEKYGCKVILTSSKPQNGTERCAEALDLLNQTYDYVVNIQGDEPQINPLQIEQIVHIMRENEADIVSLGNPIDDPSAFEMKNVVKVITNKNGFALDFIREIGNEQKTKMLKHVGIYGFKWDVLKAVVGLKPTENEINRGLEQLRWLENKYTIKIGMTQLISEAVDIPSDILKLKKYY